MTDSFSIVVPMYNVACHLATFFENCDELLATYPDIEICLVNDGSTDATDQLAKHFSDRHPDKVKYLSQKNQGVSAARNKGMDIASGDWIGFADPDDYIPVSAYEKLLNRDLRHVDIVGGNYFRVYGDRRSEKKEDAEGRHLNGLEYLLFNHRHCGDFPRTVWNNLYRKDFLRGASISFAIGVPVGEDMLFNLQAFAKAPLVIKIADTVYEYNKNIISSVTSRQNTDHLEWSRSSLILARHMLALSKTGILSGQEEVLDTFAYYFIIRIIRSVRRVQQVNEQLELIKQISTLITELKQNHQVKYKLMKHTREKIYLLAMKFRTVFH